VIARNTVVLAVGTVPNIPPIRGCTRLAGLALADPDRQRLAEQALTGCLADDQQLNLLTDTSLCHGWAGLTLTAWHTAADAGRDGELAGRLPRLRARLAGYLNRHGPYEEDGLLEGGTGARLALHTTGTDTPPPSGWDACLLLGG
jgi:lantibiotic biosynthesis protein